MYSLSWPSLTDWTTSELVNISYSGDLNHGSVVAEHICEEVILLPKVYLEEVAEIFSLLLLIYILQTNSLTIKINTPIT